MKNCQNIQVELSAFLDGELTTEQRAKVQSHVNDCPACREYLAKLELLARGIQALPEVTPEAQFLAEVRRKIRQTEKGSDSWVERIFLPVFPKVPLEALGAVLVVAGVWYLAQPPVNKTQPSSETLLLTRNEERQDSRMPAGQSVHLAQAEVKQEGGVTVENSATSILPAAAAPAHVQNFTAKPASLEQKHDLDDRSLTVRMAGTPPKPPETVIVQGETLVAVQLRATDLAKALHGSVDAVTPSNTLLVSLPQSQVGVFRSQLTRAKKGTLSYAAQGTVSASSLKMTAEAPRDQAMDNLAKAKDAIPATDAVVRVEVVVQPGTTK